MKLCQIIILLLTVFGFLRALHMDFNGSKAREPYGFAGAVWTIILTALILLCYWKAGAFSTLIP